MVVLVTSCAEGGPGAPRLLPLLPRRCPGPPPLVALRAAPWASGVTPLSLPLTDAFLSEWVVVVVRLIIIHGHLSRTYCVPAPASVALLCFVQTKKSGIYWLLAEMLGGEAGFQQPGSMSPPAIPGRLYWLHIGCQEGVL